MINKFLVLGTAAIFALILPTPTASPDTEPQAESPTITDIDPTKFDVRKNVFQTEIDLTQHLASLQQTGRLDLDLGPHQIQLEATPIDMRGPDWAMYHIDAEKGTTTQILDAELGTYRARLTGQQEFTNPLTIVPGYINAIIELDPCTDLVIETVEGSHGGPDSRHLVDYYLETCQTPNHETATTEPDDVDQGCDLAILSLADALALEESPTCNPLVLAGLPLTEKGVSRIANGWSRPSSTVNIKVGIGSDTQFYLAGTSTTTARQAAVLNNADSNVYGPTVNINLQIATQWTWTAGGTTQNVCGSVLNDFRTEWRTDSTLKTIVRDTTMNLYQRDLSGSTVGCGKTPGVHDPNWLGYGVVQTISRSSTEEYKTGAHEIGHNLYGEHGAAEKWWDWGDFRTEGTIMATNMKTKNKHNKFTEGDNDDFNSFRVRDCAENKSTCNTRMKNIP